MVAPTRSKLPSLTDRLVLGDQESSLQVSPFCLGMTQDPDTVLRAYDAGINFFFVTADMHWPLYVKLRQGLSRLLERGGDIRSRIVVAGVSYVTQPEFCWKPFEELVSATPGLGHLDLTIAGGVYSGELMVRLHQYRKQVRQRYLGARAMGMSFHDRDAALHAVNHQLVDVAFIRYNPLHRGAESDIFPLLQGPTRTRIFNFKSANGYVPPSRFSALGLDDDYWKPRIPDYYRFVLSRPEIHGVLCALSIPQHVDELQQALEQGPLDEEEIEFLSQLAALGKGRATLQTSTT